METSYTMTTSAMADSDDMIWLHSCFAMIWCDCMAVHLIKRCVQNDVLNVFQGRVYTSLCCEVTMEYHSQHHSSLEVQSTFYTNNPLLYVSHFSEIIVTSGYDVQQQAGSMCPRRLSGRRELVEQLDSEPLFDYLVQNGVLERPLVNDIKNEKSPAKVNLALLRHVEDNGKPAVNLFVNALRQTGQHNLASLLDDSTRIKALSGSGVYSDIKYK